MKQTHERKAKQVGRQSLLHLHRCCAKRAGNAGKCGQISVDRERSEHAQHGQQDGQRPARGRPEFLRVRIHFLSFASLDGTAVYCLSNGTR